jgi:hypothetical protein
MASGQSWTSTESLAQTTGGYDLRPLSTGEVLDRTFQLYRSRFALFAGLAALPAAINFISGALQVLTMQGDRVVNGRHFAVSSHPVATGITSIAAGIVYFALYGITQAATTWAVSEIYLGNPAALSSAWTAVRGRWFRYIVVVLRQYWSIVWLPGLFFAGALAVALVPRALRNPGLSIVMGVLMFLGFAACIYSGYVALRVALAVPAAVIEGLGPGAAVRRSMDLMVERKVRIFLLGLLVLAMSFIIGMALSPLQLIGMTAQGTERYVLQILHLTGMFFSSMVIGPVGAIGLCLFYFDERVRHEGFDIEFLMQRAGGPANPSVEGSTSPEPA